MSKSQKLTEFHVLEVFVDEMEAQGRSKNLVRLNLDETFAKRVSERLGDSISLDTIHELADRCLANEWLEPKVMGGGNYGGLELTTTGFGVVRSRQRKEQQLAERSLLKRASDYIEDHKGLFVAFAAAIGLIGILIRLLR
ncbi:hypothetical protein [Nitrosococcus watsonii]|uniref:Uncharacterized protein n=1 Tax=Nitrosococcus watsoni (strain C-113) TaxID=105559 RepID=D8K9A0_NITWC|nr:hypothetical protein [Nitrosococcus watsonii]ADJ29243.1 conserved hypothetical protein [Nitrosococcus watsonii C-113]